VTERHEQLIQAIAGNDAFKVTALLHEEPGLVEARDSEGRTPILLCLYLGKEELARLVRERTSAPDLFEVAALGEVELLQEKLARAPESAKAVAPDGFGALGLASFFGRIEAVKVLLNAGADPNTPAANDFKVSPIHSAAANRSADTSLPLCRLLLEGGADPNVAQAGGWTPLHQASAHGRTAVVELLLSHGAAVDTKSDDNRTPGEMAEAKGHEDVLSLLEQAGA
jgi:ankyrin repeat protein